jgi:toxin ParE1/3/4
LTPEAQEDVRDILVYTERQWGKAQRQAYKRLLTDAFSQLATYPQSGQFRPEYGSTIRSHPVGQHVILYEPSTTEIKVVRVVHGKRDPARELL